MVVVEVVDAYKGGVSGGVGRLRWSGGVVCCFGGGAGGGERGIVKVLAQVNYFASAGHLDRELQVK